MVNTKIRQFKLVKIIGSVFILVMIRKKREKIFLKIFLNEYFWGRKEGWSIRGKYLESVGNPD
jgi:hypothetical protein